MVEDAVLDATFQALSHPTRRAMLRALAAGERSVGELAQPFDVSLAAASKHLKVLERAGLIERRIHGRVHTCRMNPHPLGAVSDCAEGLKAVFEANFGRLDALLDDLKSLERAALPFTQPNPPKRKKR
ncbi:MAG: metalloregulator ArsR/SmtB family transcription factor [Planctomycetaceae bacterium]|nr:metalloregulator ArsR/SmtB family transcription factor [Planctomycetaceae bacterium]